MNSNQLEKLVMAFGVSGHEELAKKVWEDQVKANAYEIKDIPEQNCYALASKIDKSKPLVYLSSHIDEIGFVVTHITEKGYLYFAPVDNNIFDLTAIRAKKVNILHKGEVVKGVIGHPPSHCLPWDSNQTVHWKNLWIDIGAKSYSEAIQMISIGDPIRIEKSFDILNDAYVSSGALDNRVGCYVVAEVFNQLAKKLKNVNFIAGVQVQEEIDQRGGQMASQFWKPNLNIVIDMVFALDHPDVDARNIGDADFGKGPVIVWNSALNKKFTAQLLETAQNSKLPVQQIAWGGKLPTDAFHMSKVDHGIPSILIGIPLRYMHTNVEMVHLEDVTNAIKLLTNFIMFIDSNPLN